MDASIARLCASSASGSLDPPRSAPSRAVAASASRCTRSIISRRLASLSARGVPPWRWWLRVPFLVATACRFSFCSICIFSRCLRFASNSLTLATYAAVCSGGSLPLAMASCCSAFSLRLRTCLSRPSRRSCADLSLLWSCSSLSAACRPPAWSPWSLTSRTSAPPRMVARGAGVGANEESVSESVNELESESVSGSVSDSVSSLFGGIESRPGRLPFKRSTTVGAPPRPAKIPRSSAETSLLRPLRPEAVPPRLPETRP
mmetsp:Transcript_13867/g.54976  ORF Transcript_13867/g.54976 Transcript_13867/m.54976 type:complete len:260 (+) Transcript_13867:201-980(+)